MSVFNHRLAHVSPERHGYSSHGANLDGCSHTAFLGNLFSFAASLAVWVMMSNMEAR